MHISQMSDFETFCCFAIHPIVNYGIFLIEVLSDCNRVCVRKQGQKTDEEMH